MRSLRKWGSKGEGDGQFGIPGDVAIAPDGTVWIADDPNGRYEAFSSTGAFRATFKIVLKTNGRPTTQTANVTVRVS